ncbi:MAG: bifunctional demethylmenaquinone methyltransferase/2-methoxy-6-polyprenyl-1,4-benzoquinol methylase UbiE [Rhodothalassiaceae bacterium]
MSSAATEDGNRVAFGERLVPEDEKARLVHGVFARVARRYDLMNDLMSGGLHRLWKTSLIDSLAPHSDMHLLDVAGGTGDIAFRFLEAGGGHVTLLDINEKMLAVGRARALRRGVQERADFTVGDAEALPVADRAVDAYSIAFGIRNVTHIDRALAEARRVLRFGGRFLCLEFCPEPALPLLDELYRRYSDAVIPRLGAAIAGDAESYRYLVESIRRFPDPEHFAAMMQSAGFERVSSRPLSGGICAIHQGFRV